MRMHLNKYLTVMTLILILVFGTMQVYAEEMSPVIETITLDEDMDWDNDIPADISWKTSQDKGQWIEEWGIAKDATSLVLVINNLDKEDPNAIPLQEDEAGEEKRKSIASWNRLQGKSRLFYFSKGADGEWSETFSLECFISGGSVAKKEDLYGVYEPVSTFSSIGNPGSLLPYRGLSVLDYWSLDPESENYGSIFSVEKSYIKPERAVNLSSLKSYSNYGMILHPEEEYSSCPPLVINCQQTQSNNDVLCGFQMPQENLRMMIQSIDKATRFFIVENLADLENM